MVVLPHVTFIAMSLAMLASMPQKFCPSSSLGAIPSLCGGIDSKGEALCGALSLDVSTALELRST